MRSTFVGAVERLRRPEYTGENRCLPCTVVNLVIAAVLGAAAATVWLPAGVVVLLGSVALVGLRGYLVPGTPTLTKRYLPDRVLALFDTHHGADEAEVVGEVDAESLLREAGIVVECDDVDDLCVDEAFRTSWERAAAAAGDPGSDTGPGGAVADATAIARVLDVDPGRVTIETFDDALVAELGTDAGSRRVGQWESRAAFLVDVGAVDALAEHLPSWASLSPQARSEVLGTVRVFVETCPECGGPARLQAETVESCCRSFDVAAASCGECGSRLFEVELPG